MSQVWGTKQCVRVETVQREDGELKQRLAVKQGHSHGEQRCVTKTWLVGNIACDQSLAYPCFMPNAVFILPPFPWNDTWVETVAGRMGKTRIRQNKPQGHICLLRLVQEHGPISTQVPFQLRRFAVSYSSYICLQVVSLVASCNPNHSRLKGNDETCKIHFAFRIESFSINTDILELQNKIRIRSNSTGWGIFFWCFRVLSWFIDWCSTVCFFTMFRLWLMGFDRLIYESICL